MLHKLCRNKLNSLGFVHLPILVILVSIGILKNWENEIGAVLCQPNDKVAYIRTSDSIIMVPKDHQGIPPGITTGIDPFGPHDHNRPKPIVVGGKIMPTTPLPQEDIDKPCTYCHPDGGLRPQNKHPRKAS